MIPINKDREVFFLRIEKKEFDKMATNTDEIKKLKKQIKDYKLILMKKNN